MKAGLFIYSWINKRRANKKNKRNHRNKYIQIILANKSHSPDMSVDVQLY